MLQLEERKRDGPVGIVGWRKRGQCKGEKAGATRKKTKLEIRWAKRIAIVWHKTRGPCILSSKSNEVGETLLLDDSDEPFGNGLVTYAVELGLVVQFRSQGPAINAN